MRMSESISTIKDKVGFILDRFGSTRDSDKLLWLAYLCENHDLKLVLGKFAYENLKEIIMDENTPTMESIRRVRQKLQEQGLYVGKKRADRLAEQEKVKEVLR